MKKIILTSLMIVMGVAVSAEARPGKNKDRRPGLERDRHRDHRGGNRGYQMCPERVHGYTLDIYDAHYRGRGNVIPLKRELLQAYPRLRGKLQNMKLKRVCIVAKSKHGGGEASLVVGQMSQDRVRVPGSPNRFHNPRIRTFDELTMNNYGSSQGRWQLELRGNIKVNKVVVYAKKPRRGGHYSMQYQSHNGIKYPNPLLQKHVTKTVDINQYGVEEISLIGKNGKLNIERAVVYFRNGTSARLHNLEGKLEKGEKVSAYVNSRNVTYMTIKATSLKFRDGSRSKLDVEVGYR